MDVNELQGKSDLWKNKCCVRCKRTTEETVLNIEAIIHHNASNLECVDRASCKKHIKKLKEKSPWFKVRPVAWVNVR